MREALRRIKCEEGDAGDWRDWPSAMFSQCRDQPTTTGYPKGLLGKRVRRGSFESHLRVALVSSCICLSISPMSSHLKDQDQGVMSTCSGKIPTWNRKVENSSIKPNMPDPQGRWWRTTETEKSITQELRLAVMLITFRWLMGIQFSSNGQWRQRASNTNNLHLWGLGIPDKLRRFYRQEWNQVRIPLSRKMHTAIAEVSKWAGILFKSRLKDSELPAWWACEGQGYLIALILNEKR